MPEIPNKDKNGNTWLTGLVVTEETYIHTATLMMLEKGIQLYSVPNVSEGQHWAQRVMEGTENMQWQREEVLRTASGISFRGWRRLMSQPRCFLYSGLAFKPIVRENF